MRFEHISNYFEVCDMPLEEVYEWLYDAGDDKDKLAKVVRWYIDNVCEYAEVKLVNDEDEYLEAYQVGMKPNELDRDGKPNKNYQLEMVVWELVDDFLFENADDEWITEHLSCKNTYEYSESRYEDYCEQEWERRRDEGEI